MDEADLLGRSKNREQGNRYFAIFPCFGRSSRRLECTRHDPAPCLRSFGVHCTDVDSQTTVGGAPMPAAPSGEFHIPSKASRI
ncbi:hypothetical protein Y032_0200g1696 [Ancylostoma ceylanicum]|uniref:Uncharacterized protein n=1 Tax=Ancylostoma ceylanicum TaxID=53326 RepID=A0A016SMT6_9BILA|nr:hypothetical protein Y032_0200g1696 [Ancylostoma ceylanicum]